MYFNGLDEKESRISQSQDRITKLKLRIQELMKNSKEQAFTDYLRYMQNSIYDAENRVLFLSSDLEKQYRIYQMNQEKLKTQEARPAQPESQVLTPPPAQPELQVLTPPPARPEPSVLTPPPAQQPHREKKKKNIEYAVATAVLGIVGSAFILTAMVLLGMYFLEGFWKGILLYAASFAVMVLSESLLYRKFPRLGMLFSAISMAGLYISTLVNYLALGNFNEWIAIGITTAITAFIIVLSRKRDAVSYRVLGMIAMYCCFYIALWEKQRTNELMPIQLVTVGVMLFVIHIMCMAVPVKHARTAMNIVQLSLNTFFSYVVYIEWMKPQIVAGKAFTDIWHDLFFMGIALLIAQIIYIVQTRDRIGSLQRDGKEVKSSIDLNIGICITYGVSMLCYCQIISSVARESLWSVSEEGQGWQYRLGFLCVIALLSFLTMCFLAKWQEKWLTWFFLLGSVLIIYLPHAESTREMVWVLFAVLMVSKLFCFSDSMLPLVCDMILTALVCVVCAMMVVHYDVAMTFPLIAGIFLSILFLRKWQTYYEIVLSFTISWYVSHYMLNMLRLPVFVGILFLCILVFNNVRRWHGEGIVVFNIFALCGQAVCYLLLAGPVYRNAHLTYICMLIFGIATIVICFQNAYHLEFEGKYMVLPVFLTYMVIICRIGYSVVNSILLMCIALGCVGVGFYIKKKTLRVYGLVLSLLTCGKLVLYDFAGGNTFTRTVMFFAVGVIALIIASIYIVLEKKQEKKELESL